MPDNISEQPRQYDVVTRKENFKYDFTLCDQSVLALVMKEDVITFPSFHLFPTHDVGLQVKI